jgi:Asp-tRNA(Asn)/Glu-tRNA(Gln) amidotransferase A subunit family amidase
MRLYISGPMTGFPDHNRAAFEEAAEALRAQGYEVVTPVDLDADKPEWFNGSTGWEVDDETYNDLLERDVDEVALADGIVFIPGWAKSGGAGREGEHARELKKAMYTWTPDMPDRLLWLHGYVFDRYHTTKRLEKVDA